MFNDVLFGIKRSGVLLEPLRVFTTDKEYLKLYVAATVGHKHNVPSFQILRLPEMVDAYVFPENCCIKPTHLSGQVILRRNSAYLDKAQMKAWFKKNRYDIGREQNYKYLSPKIIVEPLIGGSDNITDYKIFCFKGKARLIQLDFDRYTNHTRKLLTPEWEELPVSILYERNQGPCDAPTNLNEMLSIAEKLAKPFDFVRIDLYLSGDQILVGEITHCSENAGGIFVPARAEQTVSQLVFSED